MAIRFFSETDKFNFRNKRKTSTWLKNVVKSYGKIPGNISIIFCSDEQLLEINKSYLKHFYYTDVITFNYNEGNILNGDIYLSIERVADNSGIFNVSFTAEINRIMVHGILHLLGFNDSNEKEKSNMRSLEDYHLKELEL